MGKAPSLQQIRKNAAKFAAEWRDAEGYERGEAQEFVRALLAVYGITGNRAGLYEYRAKRNSTGQAGFIDALIPKVVVIEMKSAGKDLAAAERQAIDYLDDLPMEDQPSWVLSSDFKNFRLLDLENQADGPIVFTLDELPAQAERLAFLAGYGTRKFSTDKQEDASIKAAQLMAGLWEKLEGSGLTDHEASTFMVRTLFCLYADDAAVWERDQFLEYIETRTQEDGSDLGAQMAVLFQAMSRPIDQRFKNLDELVARFPYVNGGIFEEQLAIASFNKPMRDALIECCAFNWADISPAIFGSLFQAVKDQEARHQLGEHYTTETNIKKLIGPMFLDDLERRFEDAHDDAKRLKALREHMGRMRFLDPAAGCGNFLVVTYREMRRLDLDVVKRLQELGSKDQTASLFFGQDQLEVTLDHFHGIEIEEWPAQIARTALHLAEHQANQAMALALGAGPDTLPLTKVDTVHVGNAIRTDWTQVVAPTQHLYIVGNPPFLGKAMQTPSQKEDLKLAWGSPAVSHLDYVTAWYAKASQMLARGDYDGEFAFVSTNSITQGEQVPALFGPLFGTGWRLKFAHRTFTWTSEAPGAAAVHCVILGFDKHPRQSATLFDYDDPRGEPHALPVERQINGYLVDGPNVLVHSRTAPMSDVPAVDYGSKATDGGHLVVEQEDFATISSDPIAAQFLRPYVGARELIHSEPRWCLWLPDADLAEALKSPQIKARLQGVRQMRETSPKRATQEAAATPHLFQEIRHRDVAHLAIPSVSSETRAYIPAQRVAADVILSNLVFGAEDPDGFAFAVVSSSVFITWQKTVGGRLKSDMRFSNTLTWNTFPLPRPTDEQRSAIVAGGQAVLDARALHPHRSLADHYNPLAMDPELLKAHRKLDKAVDAVFGLTGTVTDNDRLKALFASYEKLIRDEQLKLPKGGRRR